MLNFHRLAQNIDVGRLLASIARRPDLWDADKLRTGFEHSPHAEAHDIVLRFGPANIHDPHPNIDRPAMAALGAKQMALQIMGLVGGSELGRVLVTRLEPGKRILPHADEGEYNAYFDRYHVCLQSLPGNVFRCGDEQITPLTGELWWFNNKREHEIINNSSDSRMTLIIDTRID